MAGKDEVEGTVARPFLYEGEHQEVGTDLTLSKSEAVYLEGTKQFVTEKAARKEAKDRGKNIASALLEKDTAPDLESAAP